MNKSNEKKLRNVNWSSKIENSMRQTYPKVRYQNSTPLLGVWGITNNLLTLHFTAANASCEAHL